MMVEEAKPFYKLWVEIEKNFTSGDGYLDKLCMELVGLDSSRCRPPTRDVRSLYREKCRAMMIESGYRRDFRQGGEMTAQIQPGRRIMSSRRRLASAQRRGANS